MYFGIPDEADVEYVYEGLMHLGAKICIETLKIIVSSNGFPKTVTQDSIQKTWIKGSHSSLKNAPKIFKETCEIDWNQSSEQVYNFIRGLSPYPGAWTTLIAPDGKKTVLKIFKAVNTKLKGGESRNIVIDGKQLYISAGGNLVEILELQLEGKKRMMTSDFLNGMRGKLQTDKIIQFR